MTDEATLVPDPEPRRETLWVTDAELIRRLGVPETCPQYDCAALMGCMTTAIGIPMAAEGDSARAASVIKPLGDTRGMEA